MKLDDLTIGEAKQLARLFGGAVPEAVKDEFVGKYCIIRCYSAGVHAGELVSQVGDVVVLKDSRRLWSWRAIDGVALSGVAQNGLASGSKVDVVNPLIRLTGAIETIICSEQSAGSIKSAK